MATEIAGFAIGDLVGIVALGVGIAGLLVTAITFYIGHARSKTSEQIHISKELWDDIYALQETISGLSDEDPEFNKKAVLAINRLIDRLGYFVYLAERGEIRDPVLREYYRKQLLHTNELAISMYLNDKLSDFPGPEEIFSLIRKYHELAGKMEAYSKEFGTNKIQ